MFATYFSSTGAAGCFAAATGLAWGRNLLPARDHKRDELRFGRQHLASFLAIRRLHCDFFYGYGHWIVLLGTLVIASLHERGLKFEIVLCRAVDAGQNSRALRYGKL